MANLTTCDDIKNALWAGANTFRDNIDAANYKDYVLSMLFVKYLSDTYEESVEDLKKEYDGIRLERQIKLLPFFLEEEYKFSYLLKNKYAIDIGTKISEALIGIESANPILAGIFRGIDFNSESNLGKKEQKNPLLRNLLDDFADLDLRPRQIETRKENEVPADVIGDAYEYMIGEFATMAGKKAGTFFTPQQVSEVMAQIVTPQSKDRVYDPTCGSGSLLIRTARKGGFNNVSMYGQEVNSSAISMARMNMFIHDIKDAKISWGDTLANPQHLDSDGNLMKFECIVANMPFSKDKWAEGFNPGGEVSSDEEDEKSKNRKGKKVEFKMEAGLDRYHRFDIGIPPASKGDWAFLLHMIASMSGNGRVAAVAPHGVLFRGASEGRIRQTIIEKNLIDAVIGLPENLFFGTSIPACIVVFKKGRTTSDVLFIDASKGFTKEKAKNKLRDEDVEKIVSVYKKYTNGENAEVEKYSHIATLGEIKENEYNLNIPRYVDTFEEEELINIEAVNVEIADLKTQIAQIEKEMVECLKELGL